MKKFIAIVLIGLMAFGLVGCADGGSQETNSSNNISFVSENDDSGNDASKIENVSGESDVDTTFPDAPKGDLLAYGGMEFEHGGRVDITVFEEENGVKGGAVFALEGKDVLMDMNCFYATIMVFEELDIDNYNCMGFAEESAFMYMKENGEFSPYSVSLPKKFASTKPDEEDTVDIILSLLGTIKFVDKKGNVLDTSENLKEEEKSSTNSSNANRDLIDVYEDEFVSVKYSHNTKAYRDEVDIVFVVENKTNVTLTFGVNSISVDGWNLSDAFGMQEVSANSRGYFSISTKEIDVTNIELLSGDFYVADRSETIWGDLMYDIVFNQVSVQN